MAQTNTVQSIHEAASCHSKGSFERQIWPVSDVELCLIFFACWMFFVCLFHLLLLFLSLFACFMFVYLVAR